jgi:uncharacterized protein
MSRVDQSAGRVLASLTSLAGRRPVAMLLMTAALGAASLVYTAGHLGVNSDSEALFDPSLPFQQRRHELEREFPMLGARVLAVVDADSGTRARDAARALAERLRAEPDQFRHVFVPGDGPFFEKNGLLYLETGELEELVDDLSVAQPFLAELSRDRSLRGFFGLLATALEEAPDLAGFDLSRTFVLVQQAVQAAAKLRARPVRFDELTLAPASTPGAPSRSYVELEPVRDFSAFIPAGASMSRLHEIVGQLRGDPSLGAKIRVTGEVALEYEEMESVQRNAVRSLGISLFLVLAILAFSLRSPWLVAGTQVTLLVGLLWTAAFAALAIGHLNVISIAFAVMFVGLGVDFGIHFCLRYVELRRAGSDHLAALRETGESTGSSLFLCATTTAIGFYAFAPTGYAGVAELGLIAGTGMFLSLLATLTVLPAWMSLGAARRERVPREGPRLGLALARLSERRPQAVLAGAVLVAAAAGALATRWHFDPNPLHVRDPNTESARTFADLLASGGINPWTAELLAPDLQSADASAERLSKLPEVDRALTLDSFVPDHQDDKLAILHDAALLLNLAGPGEVLPPPTEAEDLAALRHFRRALEGFSHRADPGISGAAGALVAALDRFLDKTAAAPDQGEALARLRESLVAPTLARLDELAISLGAAKVTRADLPDEIRERMIASDGRARVEVFPKGDLNDNRDLIAFTEAVRGVAPEATGVSIYMVDTARLITASLAEAFGLALLTMTLLLWLLWRSVGDTLRVLAPLGMAALVTAASGVLVGLPINFADVIVLPLLLGIGVDTGIHLVHRFRTSDDADLADTSTSRGVVWSAATTIASFGTLGIATHLGMASLGQLLSIGVLATLLANVLIVPALLTLSRRREVAALAREEAEEV